MAIPYPTGLRGPISGKSKDQFSSVTTTTPLSGSAYIQKLSTDAPAVYDLSFIFDSPDEASYFRAWVTVNNIDRGVEFDVPIRTEFDEMDGNETQTVKFIPSGDSSLLSNTSNSMGVFNYAGKFQCRKEITGLEDEYEFIVGLPFDTWRDRGIIDVAINISAPEA